MINTSILQNNSKYILKIKMPLKVKIFLWLLYKGVILMKHAVRTVLVLTNEVWLISKYS
jgi:hypothetical protein